MTTTPRPDAAVLAPARVPRNVLVPIDGSPFAERAIPIAAGYARLFGARLHLVRVHVPVVGVPVPGDLAMPVYDARWDVEAREAARGYLARLADEVRAETGLDVTTALLEGRVAEAIAEYETERDCGLVVSASHGRGGLARILEGSVTDQLVREGRAPVLVVHPDEEPRPERTTEPPRRVLVPLDTSLTAEQALPLAAEVARRSGAELLLFHAILPSALSTGSEPGNSAIPGPPGESAPLVEAARRYLDEVRARLGADVAVATRVTVAPEPAEAILALATEWDADLVAIASHGHGGLRRALVGSVADRVVRGAPVAVLVVRAREGA